MVRSFAEIVYSIIELIRANYKVTDSLDERLVAGWVQSARAEILKQRLSEPGYADEHSVQDLGSVEMESVDASVYGVSEKYILRSKNRIPKVIYTRKKGYAFTRVGPADRSSKTWNFVSQERALYSGNGKFNKNTIYAFLDDGYLCIVSRNNLYKLIKHINIKGVFQNPIDAYEFGGGTYTWDMEYPISDGLVDAIKVKIINENFNFVLNPLDDKSPDSVDNLTIPATEEGGQQSVRR